MAVCKFILPLWLKFKEHLAIQIRMSPAELSEFRERKHVVILANHPDRQDPFIVAQLAKFANEDLNVIVAREVFDWDWGWRGWLLQSLGCYSVSRGRADFRSIASTAKIIKEGQHKLVVFPEGEITSDEEVVHEVQKAIFHIMLDVQKELSEKSIEDSVIVIPMAIKFSLETDLSSSVESVLKKIEGEMGIAGAEQSIDVFARINLIIQTYLQTVINAYDLQWSKKSNLEGLAELAAVEILQKIAAQYALSYDVAAPPCEQLYKIRYGLGERIESDSVALRQEFHCGGVPKPCLRSDLERVERLLILHRSLEHPKSEMQACRNLDFIESELFGKITPKGRQKAYVNFGASIEVSDYLELYKESKEGAIDKLTSLYKKRMQSLLDGSPIRDNVIELNETISA